MYGFLHALLKFTLEAGSIPTQAIGRWKECVQQSQLHYLRNQKKHNQTENNTVHTKEGSTSGVGSLVWIAI
jgi:hypothetical protein